MVSQREKGQEISLLSIVYLDYNSAYSLSVEQTPPKTEIGNEETRIDIYLQQIKKQLDHYTLGLYSEFVVSESNAVDCN